MAEPHTHGGTDAPECTTCKSTKLPIEEAMARIKAYIDAVPTLYDDQNPMHPELELDTATNWTDMTKATSHALAYKDLVALVEFVEGLQQKTGKQLIQWAETKAGLW